LASKKKIMKREEIPEPYKSDNKKAKLTSVQTFWIVMFSILLAIIYTIVNIA